MELERKIHNPHALDLIDSILHHVRTYESMRYLNPHMTSQAKARESMHAAIEKYFKEFEAEFIFDEGPDPLPDL